MTSASAVQAMVAKLNAYAPVGPGSAPKGYQYASVLMQEAAALLLSLQAELDRMERDLFKAVLARAYDYVEVGEVTNNNQHGWDNIVTAGPNVTLGVGLKVFALRTDLPTPVLDTLFNNEAARESARGSE